MIKVLYKDGITHEVASQLDYDHYKRLGYVDVTPGNPKVLVEEPLTAPDGTSLTDSNEVPPVPTEEISDEDLKLIQQIKRINTLADLSKWGAKHVEASEVVQAAFQERVTQLNSLNDKEAEG